MADHQALTIRRDICRKIVNTVSAPAAIGPYNQVLQGIFPRLHEKSKISAQFFLTLYYVCMITVHIPTLLNSTENECNFYC